MLEPSAVSKALVPVQPRGRADSLYFVAPMSLYERAASNSNQTAETWHHTAAARATRPGRQDGPPYVELSIRALEVT